MPRAPPEFFRCPDCGKQLRFICTIRRDFEPNVEVWSCEPCQTIIVRKIATDTRH